MSIQPKRAGEIASSSVLKMSMQLMELAQADGLQQRVLIDQVNQASQKVIAELGIQIESLKTQQAFLQEQLRVSESLQQSSAFEDSNCVAAHRCLIANLEGQLKTSQNTLEMRKGIAKGQLEGAKYHLKAIEDCLRLSKDIAQGVVTKKWLDTHKDWN